MLSNFDDTMIIQRLWRLPKPMLFLTLTLILRLCGERNDDKIQCKLTLLSHSQSRALQQEPSTVGVAGYTHNGTPQTKVDAR
jgi:hypothetical protein